MRCGSILLFFVIALSGCVTHEYVVVDRNYYDFPPYNLSVGDVVVLVTSDAQSLEFEITLVPYARDT